MASPASSTLATSPTTAPATATHQPAPLRPSSPRPPTWETDDPPAPPTRRARRRRASSSQRPELAEPAAVAALGRLAAIGAPAGAEEPGDEPDVRPAVGALLGRTRGVDVRHPRRGLRRGLLDAAGAASPLTGRSSPRVARPTRRHWRGSCGIGQDRRQGIRTRVGPSFSTVGSRAHLAVQRVDLWKTQGYGRVEPVAVASLFDVIGKKRAGDVLRRSGDRARDRPGLRFAVPGSPGPLATRRAPCPDSAGIAPILSRP